MASYHLWAVDLDSDQACVQAEGGQWFLLSSDNAWEPVALEHESEVMRWALTTPAVRTNRKFRSLDALVKALQVDSQRAVEELQPPPIAEGVRDWPDSMFRPGDEWGEQDKQGDYFWAYVLELADRFPAPGATPMVGWEDTYHLSVGDLPTLWHDQMARATRRAVREHFESSDLSSKELHMLADGAEWTSADQASLAQLLMVIALRSVLTRTDDVERLLRGELTTREIVSPWLGLYAEITHGGRDGQVSDAQILAALYVDENLDARNWATSVQEWHRFRNDFNFGASAVAYARVFDVASPTSWLSYVMADRHEGVQQLRTLYTALGQLTRQEREVAVLALAGMLVDAHSLAVLDQLRRLVVNQPVRELPDEQVATPIQRAGESLTSARPSTRPSTRPQPRTLVARVAEKLGASTQMSATFVDAVAEVMREALEAGKDVHLKGFGKLSVKDSAASVRIRLQTRAKVKGQGRRQAKFTLRKRFVGPSGKRGKSTLRKRFVGPSGKRGKSAPSKEHAG